MKFVTLILFISLATASAKTSYSQSAKFTLNLEHATVKELFDKIEKNSEFIFVYYDNIIDLNKKVSVKADNETIEEILGKVFKSSENTFKVFDRQIVIAKKESSAADLEAVLAQQPQKKEISGTVKDSKGISVPGVSVIVKGTSTGTVTDADGKFRLSIPINAKILVFSFVGMKTQEIAVSSETNFNVSMTDETFGLDEVVAIGYGTQRKMDLTGSVASVKMSELADKPVTSVGQALQGKAAGMIIINTNGEPGADIIMRIRGGNSIKNSNRPLIVVDGIPSDIDIASIAPADIESIDILKDASSTAIYGSRGANGVVMITTKRGAEGKTAVEFSYYKGFQNVRKEIKMLNGREYAEYINEREVLSGFLPRYSQSYLNDSTAGTNWQKEVLRTAPVNNYQLTLKGGGQNSKYSLSFGYFDQEGIVINSNFKRYTMRLNFDINVNSKLKLLPSISLGRTSQSSNILDESVIYDALLNSPLDLVSSDGDWIIDPFTGEETLNVTPVKKAKERVDNTKKNFVQLSMPVYYTIIPDLTLMVRFGASYNQSLRNKYTPLSLVGDPARTNANISNFQSTNLVNENTLSYIRKFGDHSLNLLAGFTAEEYYSEGATAQASGFANDNLLYHNLGSGTILLPQSSGSSRTALLSGLFRVNYNYHDKYLLTATGRTDGSSKFGENNKWGLFPSGALAWRLSEEDFIKNLNIFSNIKLRLTYGRTGNQGFPPYSSLDLRSDNKTAFNNLSYPASYASSLPNQMLSWETTDQLDAGMDVGFFDNRLSLTLDYYKKKTNRLMLDKKVPYYTGFSTIVDNVGTLDNKGFEITVDGRILDRTFKWSTSVNVSFNKNEVMSLADGGIMIPGQFESSGNYAGIIGNMIIVGQPLGTFYGYKTNGIFQYGEDMSQAPKQPNSLASRPGDIRYIDISGAQGVPDGIISDFDKQILGDAMPKLSFGVTNTFDYKNFDLTIFMNGYSGNKIFNMSLYRTYSVDGFQNVAAVKDRWRAPTLDTSGNPISGTGNPSNTIPRLLSRQETRPVLVSDRYIEDGSFIRLRNITLGYNFSRGFLTKLDISRVRVYCDLQNYVTWTKYSGFDPEVSEFGDNNTGLGIDKYTFPMTKSVTFGLQVAF